MMSRPHPRQPRRASTASGRGTVLIMVIGVLALLAIIAVAYVTIGRADRLLVSVRPTMFAYQFVYEFTPWRGGALRSDMPQ